MHKKSTFTKRVLFVYPVSGTMATKRKKGPGKSGKILKHSFTKISPRAIIVQYCMANDKISNDLEEQ